MNSLSCVTKSFFWKSKSLVPPVSSRMTSNCVFCKIVTREAPSNILHEVGTELDDSLSYWSSVQDEQFLVFPDISPASKHHLLVIAKVNACLTYSWPWLICNSLGPHCGHPVPHLHRHPLGPGHGEGWAECAGEDRRWPQHLYNWVPLASPHCVSSPHACHLPPGRGVGQEDHLLHLVLRGHSECCQDAAGEIISVLYYILHDIIYDI